MNIENQMKMIFENYNDALAQVYDTLLMQQAAQQPQNAGELFGLDKIAARRMTDWFENTPLHHESDETIANFLQTLDEPADFASMIICASYVCDDGIPDYIARLEPRRMDQITDRVIQHITRFSWQAASPRDPVSDDILSVSTLLDWLGTRSSDAHYGAMLDKFIHSEVPYDLVSDAFIQYTLTAARSQITLIIETLDARITAASSLRKVDEALLSAVVRMAAGSGNTAVYQCVSRCLTATPRKNLAAACLADLGDTRAIGFLRDWLEHHPDASSDRLLVAEILNTLRVLGDDISDLAELAQA